MFIQRITLLLGLLLSLSTVPCFSAQAERELYFRENLARAKPGDFLVTMQNKNLTVLLIRSKTGGELSIEEITIPACRIQGKQFSWRNWVKEGAPGNTSWLMYTLDLSTGAMVRSFSFTRNEWVNIPQTQNFLSTLLNLQFKPVADRDRKRAGVTPSGDARDRRTFWQPKLILDGSAVDGVTFDAWKTRWPKDGSDLAGKIIEVYVPQENDRYPSYFPYWLQVSGIVGNAKVRIVDSGTGLIQQPADLPTYQQQQTR